VELAFGPEGVCELAALEDADVVVGAIMGWAGFAPAVRALERGRVLALANKEALVVGGEILRGVAQRSGGIILPVDSEQSAVLQAMRSGRREEVARVVITASGGPFRGMSKDRLERVTPEQALQHPTWRMGRKITIDSATMMNKALEIVETRWLFDVDPDRIQTVIHPQSIVHSLVEFVDGSVVAQLGVPDMKLPIQFALTYPDRVPGPVERLDLARIGSLELMEADPEEFPALTLGYEVARKGGTSGAVLNAANEVAVESFLQGKIKFTDIVPLVATVLRRHTVREHPDAADLERADRWARQEALQCSTQL
jgi:1-deoxy-D-xylulose-5-phosphate reductoisomerase